MRPNEFQKAGIPTCHNLTSESQFKVRYIQGAVATPLGFARVKEVLFLNEEVVFLDVNRMRVSTPLHYDFVMKGNP